MGVMGKEQGRSVAEVDMGGGEGEGRKGKETESA